MIVGALSRCLAPGAQTGAILTAILCVALGFAAFAPASAALINPLAYPSQGSFEVGIGNAVVIDTTLNEIRVNGILAFTGTVDTQSGAADVVQLGAGDHPWFEIECAVGVLQAGLLSP